ISLLLHIINTALVFFFIYLLTEKKVAALVVALLFGVHPMHVESVSWVSAQKDLLYVCFYLAALICYILHLKGKFQGWKAYALIIFFFVLSLLSKGQAVTLPVVMVMVDLYVKKNFSWKMVIEKIPFFLLSIAFGVIAILAQKESASIQDIKLYSWGDR